jgi:ELWxxDGT repeat protein
MKALGNLLHAGRMVRVLLVFVLTSLNLSAQQLVKDVNQSENPNVNEYNRAVDVNGTIFFNSFDELWVTKGTRESSMRLKRFKTLGKMVRVGSRIFFDADGGEGVELWRSDGTTNGTVLVKDIFAGNGSGSPDELTAVGSIVYFVADNGVSGREIWKSNGTASGTSMVKDILAGKGPSKPSGLTNVNGKLFFAASDGGRNNELWMSDGSYAGTRMVKNINSTEGSGSFPKDLTAVNGVLYFTADNSIAGRELWKSDGSSAGTSLVKDIASGVNSSRIMFPTAVGNALFFAADDKIHGIELWKSNGTSAGTTLVKDLTPGPAGSAGRGDWGQFMSSFKKINGKL